MWGICTPTCSPTAYLACITDKPTSRAMCLRGPIAGNNLPQLLCRSQRDLWTTVRCSLFRANWVKVAKSEPQRGSTPDEISPIISCLRAAQPHHKEFIGKEERGRKKTDSRCAALIRVRSRCDGLFKTITVFFLSLNKVVVDQFHTFFGSVVYVLFSSVCNLRYFWYILCDIWD